MSDMGNRHLLWTVGCGVPFWSAVRKRVLTGRERCKLSAAKQRAGTKLTILRRADEAARHGSSVEMTRQTKLSMASRTQELLGLQEYVDWKELGPSQQSVSSRLRPRRATLKPQQSGIAPRALRIDHNQRERQLSLSYYTRRHLVLSYGLHDHCSHRIALLQVTLLHRRLEAALRRRHVGDSGTIPDQS